MYLGVAVSWIDWNETEHRTIRMTLGIRDSCLIYKTC